MDESDGWVSAVTFQSNSHLNEMAFKKQKKN